MILFLVGYHNLQFTLAILLTLIIALFSSAMALLDILKLTLALEIFLPKQALVVSAQLMSLTLHA